MLYLSSSAIEKNHITDILKICAEHGIKYIELSGGTKYYEKIWDDLIWWKNQSRLVYSCHAYFPPPPQDFVINLASCNDKIYHQSLQHYFNCIERLASLNCQFLSIHAGFLIEVNVAQIGKEITADIIYDEKKAIDRFCCAYRAIVKKAHKHQIRVYLENNVLDKNNYKRFQNHNYFLMTDSTSIKKLKQELDFDLLLDLGHLFVSCHTLLLDYQKEVTNLERFVQWLHISNNNGITDEHKILTPQSPVLHAFLYLLRPELNVTLEVKDSIEMVIKNYKWINSLITETTGRKDG